MKFNQSRQICLKCLEWFGCKMQGPKIFWTYVNSVLQLIGYIAFSTHPAVSLTDWWTCSRGGVDISVPSTHSAMTNLSCPTGFLYFSWQPNQSCCSFHLFSTRPHFYCQPRAKKNLFKKLDCIISHTLTNGQMVFFQEKVNPLWPPARHVYKSTHPLFKGCDHGRQSELDCLAIFLHHCFLCLNNLCMYAVQVRM